MIEFRNVKKIYKTKKGIETLALNNINLKIENKGMIFIVGSSGSGKSTLLNLLGGLDNPTSGELVINGSNISQFSHSQYDAYRNTYIGFVFQEFNVLEQYNVYENIELACKLQSQDITKQQIDKILERLGLKDLGNRQINELSGGQKQRVAIARALIKKPKIILADEPTGNLDKNASKQILEILKQISKEQLIIMVSHDKEAATKYADRIIQIEDGNIINDTNPSNDITIDPFELKKSKLPFSYALKMALTSLKIKPIKCIMTILLTSISLICMGFTVNCTLFDNTKLVVNTMKKNQNYNYIISKKLFEQNGSKSPLSLEEKDIENIQNIVNTKLNLTYILYDKGNPLTFEFGKNDRTLKYYPLELYPFQFTELEDNQILGQIIGREPKQENEIVVHQYFIDYIMKFGIMTSENTLYFPTSYEEVIETKKEIKLGSNKVIITGIIKEDDSDFKTAKETGQFTTLEAEQYFTQNYIYKGLIIYVKGFTKKVILQKDKQSLLQHTTIKNSIIEGNTKTAIGNIQVIKEPISIITKEGTTSLSTLEKDQIILSINDLKTFHNQFVTDLNTYLETNSHMVYEEAIQEFTKLYLQQNSLLNANIEFYVREKTYQSKPIQVKIIGISLDGNNYISNQYIEEYTPIEKEIYNIRVYDKNVKNLTHSLKQLLYGDFFENSKLDSGIYYSYHTPLDTQYTLAHIMSMYRFLAPYILIISLVFTLFTFLLFSNFIAVSISYCKKEIGILRALGATNRDIIKIFGYESPIMGNLHNRLLHCLSSFKPIIVWSYVIYFKWNCNTSLCSIPYISVHNNDCTMYNYHINQ